MSVKPRVGTQGSSPKLLEDAVFSRTSRKSTADLESKLPGPHLGELFLLGFGKDNAFPRTFPRWRKWPCSGQLSGQIPWAVRDGY